MLHRLALAVGAVSLLAASAQAAPLKGECPAGYEVKAGLNTDFPSGGLKRAFFVYPADVPGPAPVWVPLTGSVESTNANLNVARSGANALMAGRGFTVVAPIRQCAEQDPNVGGAKGCNGPGKNGWNWEPWNEGRAAGPAGDRYKIEEGADSRFFTAMLKCVATRFPLDDRRLYLGGISSGGTMTNRALTFRSDFWAGGLPISGEWYVTKDDGGALSFEAARKAVADAPAKVHQGRIGPYPLPKRLSPLIVITVWGGEKDLWRCAGDVLCADYRPSTQAGSNYFASLPNVVHVACIAGHGHMWPQVNTQAFNTWALNTLASHPKGSDPKRFRLTPPPEGYSCKVGRFTDLY